MPYYQVGEASHHFYSQVGVLTMLKSAVMELSTLIKLKRPVRPELSESVP